MNLPPAVREYLKRKVGISLPTTTTVVQVVEQHVHNAEAHLAEVADETDLFAAVDAYLLSTHSSTWGRNFSIDSEEGRQRAAAYILNTLRGVSKEIQ